MMISYIVLCGQVVGSGPFEIVYNWNGELFTYKPAAIKAGFEIRGSDDFNIGVIEDGRLTRLDWMNEMVTEDKAELREIETQLGLRETMRRRKP